MISMNESMIATNENMIAMNENMNWKYNSYKICSIVFDKVT